MRLVVLFAILAIGLPFVIADAAMPYGNAVSQRFLERPTGDSPRFTIPSETAAGITLDASSLSRWIITNRKSAQGYAAALIPLDVLYLACLGAFLGLASKAMASIIAWPKKMANVPVGLWWTLPSLYIACDLVEDALIVYLLNSTSTVDAGAFSALTILRAIKLGSVALAMAQVVLLTLLSFLWPRVPVNSVSSPP